MNKIFKGDIENLLKRLTKAKNKEQELIIINDIDNLYQLIKQYFPNEILPEFTSDSKEIINLVIQRRTLEQEIITKEIINNLDKLELLYEKLLSILDVYHINHLNNKKEEDIDYHQLVSFLKSYPGFLDIFRHLIDNEHLFYNDYNTCTYHLPSINQDYVFLNENSDDMLTKNIIHEIGHVYQSHITYSNNYTPYHFLSEFYSLLMELLYLDYHNDKILINNTISNWQELIKEALDQIKLLKLHQDAFINMEFNSQYQSEQQKIRNNDQKPIVNNLYLHFYTIDLMLALNFYYQLKYGLDFLDFESYYIQNSQNNNLEFLLDEIDPEIFNDYLREHMLKKRKSK